LFVIYSDNVVLPRHFIVKNIATVNIVYMRSQRLFTDASCGSFTREKAWAGKPMLFMTLGIILPAVERYWKYFAFLWWSSL